MNRPFIFGLALLSLVLISINPAGAQRQERSRQPVVRQPERSPVTRQSIPNLVEGEDLVSTARATQGQVSQQPMARFGRSWSQDAQLLWAPLRDGARITLTVSVRPAGSYSIAGYFTKAPDYGTFHVYVNENNVGEPFDGFAPRVEHSGKVALGTASLRAGANTVMLTIVGKNPRSVGYLVGIDRLELTQTEAQAPDPRTPRRPVATDPSTPERGTSRSPVPTDRQFFQDVSMLDRDLNRLPTGDSWRRYLRITDLRRLAATSPDGLDATARAQLQEILTRFDRVSRDPKYRDISERPAFQAMRGSLQKFVEEQTLASGLKAPVSALVTPNLKVRLPALDNALKLGNEIFITDPGEKLSFYWFHPMPKESKMRLEVFEPIPLSIYQEGAFYYQTDQPIVQDSKEGVFAYLSFAGFLPPKPPTKPRTYLVRVVPIYEGPEGIKYGSPSNTVAVRYVQSETADFSDLPIFTTVTTGKFELKLQKLDVGNTDEDSGDEPYLIVAVIIVDGYTCDLNNPEQASARILMSAGAQGNLGADDDLPQGTTVQIPAEVGSFKADIKPIPLPADIVQVARKFKGGSQALDKAQIAVVALLVVALEEDGTNANVAKNVKSELRKQLQQIDGVLQAQLPAIIQNIKELAIFKALEKKTLTQKEVMDMVNNQLIPAIMEIQNAILKAVKDKAIASTLEHAVPSFTFSIITGLPILDPGVVDPDNVIGTASGYWVITMKGAYDKQNEYLYYTLQKPKETTGIYSVTGYWTAEWSRKEVEVK